VKTFLVKFPAAEDQTENQNLWRWSKSCPAQWTGW